MALFKAWCAGTKDKSKKKTFRTYSEKDGGRSAVLTQLGEAVRTHYDQADRIADDVARLGYDGASEILRALLPQSKRARSGDLGEILASELVEEDMGFRVPVRRMRFKDGREVAMRGDDFIGVGPVFLRPRARGPSAGLARLPSGVRQGPSADALCVTRFLIRASI